MGPELLSGLAYRDGEWDKVEQFWVKQLADNRQAGYRWAICGPRSHNLAQLWRLRGKYADAEALLLEILGYALEGLHVPFELSARADLALLLAEAGRIEDAAPHLDRCREILSSGEDWRGLAGRVYLAHAVVAAKRQIDDATPSFERAIETFQRLHLPWDEAETLRLWGNCLLASRRRGAAIQKLDAATDILNRLGAGQAWLDLVAADRQRSSAGGAEPVTHPDGLSEREVEVLRLIAAGRSNKQIADELVISLNTVTHHVSNIFDKSGAANRTEAAAYAHRTGLA
jgi:ATP/maltotriose-dependent transcriptional regulator MalT